MIRRPLAYALFLLGLAVPAQAETWSLGAHFGFQSVGGAQGSDHTTVVALPGNPVDLQPGLRLARADARHAHELYLDTGQVYLTPHGNPAQLAVLSLGYQRVFHEPPVNSPFVNGTLGAVYQGDPTQGAASVTFGAGLGIRHVLRDEHGALRVELRVDHTTESITVGRPALTSVGLKFGFDLWML